MAVASETGAPATAPLADYATAPLATLRRRLAGIRIVLREEEPIFARTTALVEQRIIDLAEEAALADQSRPSKPGTALGSNEADRKRRLLLEMEQDEEYTTARRAITHLQNTRDALIAEIAIRLDLRAERQLALGEQGYEATYGVLPQQEGALALDDTNEYGVSPSYEAAHDAWASGLRVVQP